MKCITNVKAIINENDLLWWMLKNIDDLSCIKCLVFTTYFQYFILFFHRKYNFKNETLEQIVHFFQLLINFVKESHKKKRKIEQLVPTIINHYNNLFLRYNK